MRFSTAQRAILLAGGHPDDHGGSEERAAVNVAVVAHAAGIAPGSIKELLFSMRLVSLNWRKLVRQYPNGWYVLTDKGRLERELIRALR